MANENEFMIHALLMGIYITFLYDLLRIFRRVIPHRNFLVSLEDILFWIYSAYKVFLLMYYESNGTMRWFAVFAALAGMALYLRLVSPFFVKYTSLILQKVLQAALKLLKTLFRPVYRALRALGEKLDSGRQKNAVRRVKRKELYRGMLKKKLTFLWKVLKMNL